MPQNYSSRSYLCLVSVQKRLKGYFIWRFSPCAPICIFQWGKKRDASDNAIYMCISGCLVGLLPEQFQSFPIQRKCWNCLYDTQQRWNCAVAVSVLFVWVINCFNGALRSDQTSFHSSLLSVTGGPSQFPRSHVCHAGYTTLAAHELRSFWNSAILGPKVNNLLYAW